MLRAALLTSCVGIAVATVSASPASTTIGRGAPVPPLPHAVVYRVPVIGPAVVVRPFQPPATRYGAGHRGVDLRTPRFGAVVAAADGVVVFAGVVAGRGVVVIAHADGVRTEYEPLKPTVRAGAPVRGGMVVGHAGGRHGSCAPGECVH